MNSIRCPARHSSRKSRMPILFSFRRCPYAIRARLALAESRIPVTLREVSLKNKPAELLRFSKKGTVPVLVTDLGQVIDESTDIMIWAVEQTFGRGDSLVEERAGSLAWLGRFDDEFKPSLDNYKYHRITDEKSREYYRDKNLGWLSAINDRIPAWVGRRSDSLSLEEMALLPFIRQYAAVDPLWFQSLPYSWLSDWLDQWLKDPMFMGVMKKYPFWDEGSEGIDWRPWAA